MVDEFGPFIAVIESTRTCMLIQLTESLDVLSHQFRHGRPFRHAVMDGVLADDVLDEAMQSFPQVDDMEPEYSPLYAEGGRTEEFGELGGVFGKLKAALGSAEFIEDLSEMTGISGLKLDEEFRGAGLHAGLQGSVLDVHADLTYLEDRGWYRRVTVILYLNKDWQPEFGGSLELWNAKMTRAETTIVPVANRMVVLENTNASFHGYSPVKLPAERADDTRNCLIAHYYTSERPADLIITSGPRTLVNAEEVISKKMSEAGYRTTVSSLVAGSVRRMAVHARA